MSEQEPKAFAKVTFSEGESIEATAENTSLYTHIPPEDIKDHVWIVVDDERGARFWKSLPPSNAVFDLIAPLVVENEGELHLNLRRPNQSDTEAFDRAVAASVDVPDELPEGWK